MTEALDEFRREIDRIDSELLQLLATRFAVTEKVGQYKKQNNLPVVDPAREEVLLSKIRALAEAKGMSPDVAQKIFRSIIDEVVLRHKEIKNGQ